MRDDLSDSQVMTGVVMPNGWHFVVDKNITLRGSSPRDLVETVRQYRLDNRLPVGDPATDVANYICSQFPHNCHNVPGAYVEIIEVSRERGSVTALEQLTDDILRWMAVQIDHHSYDEIELEGEAHRRADICRNCPMNVPWNNSCGQCVESVNQLSGILRGGRSLPGDKRLTACQALRHENRSAVWLRLHKIGTSDMCPDYCWAKR